MLPTADAEEASGAASPQGEPSAKATTPRSGSSRASSSRNRSNRSRSKGSTAAKNSRSDDDVGGPEDGAVGLAKSESEDILDATSHTDAARPQKSTSLEDEPNGNTSPFHPQIDSKEGVLSNGHATSDLIIRAAGSAVSDLDMQGAEADPIEGGHALRRQRSSSTKELTGLGLANVGEKEAETLMPRRSRRAAATPPIADAKQGGNQLHNAQHGTEQGAKDDPEQEDEVGPALRHAHRDRSITPRAVEPTGGEEDGEGDIEGVTRCVCGSTDENVGLMIQCESCKCWQHCICMGMNTEDDCPDVYYCEQCKPELHIPLLRLLGVLPASRSHKKGAGRVSGKNPARDAAKELKEAKAAVALLASQNAERRRDGMEPLVATTASRQKQRASPDDENAGLNGSPTPQNDGPGSGRRSPKRRSTMNSRDSMYGGWEAIPPGLLNEDEVWNDGTPRRDSDDGAGRKRKRPGRRDDEDLSPSPAAAASTGGGDIVKRRRMSSGQPPGTVKESRRRSVSFEREDAAASGPSVAPQGSAKKSAVAGSKPPVKSSRAILAEEGAAPAVKPKQPNQYTYRKERAALAAAAMNGRPASPTPSPSKSGRRGGAASTFREGSAMGSRGGTPSLGSVKGGPWGLPDHLNHLSHLLPSAQPEPLVLHIPTTKSSTQSRGCIQGTSTAAAEVGARPSAHAYSMVDFKEAPTKVRFPGKRMTLGEMRKRVRNISDYVTRTQIEAVERGKRMKTLGIRSSPSTAPSSATDGSAQSSSQQTPVPERTQGDVSSESRTADVVPSTEAAESSGEKLAKSSGEQQRDNSQPLGAEPPSRDTTSSTAASEPMIIDEVPLSMRLMDDLTRELIAFQRKFGVPPGSATMSSGPTLASSSSTGSRSRPALAAAGSSAPEAQSEDPIHAEGRPTVGASTSMVAGVAAS
ncbi:unnamed protein product [Parajaminaea phylloscopi]